MNALRVSVELYDAGDDGAYGICWKKRSVLYYRYEGSLQDIGHDLEKRLTACRESIERDKGETWWVSIRVAALLVCQSAMTQGKTSGFPQLFPCLAPQSGSRYVFRVYLGPCPGTFEVECFDFREDIVRFPLLREFQPVDWREEKTKSTV